MTKISAKLLILLTLIIVSVDIEPISETNNVHRQLDSLSAGVIRGLHEMESVDDISVRTGVIDRRRLELMLLSDAEPEVLQSLTYDIAVGDTTIKALATGAKAQNYDTIGWIYIGGTGINYPIVSRAGADNFYLTHDINLNKSKSGAIFLDDALDGNFGDITLLHGHSMRDGSMFGELLKYKDSHWADEHLQIFLFDGLFVKEYEVFACLLFNANNEELPIRFASELERDGYYSRVIDRSKLGKREIADASDVLVMNTCSYEADNFRCLVFASCVRKNGR